MKRWVHIPLFLVFLSILCVAGCITSNSKDSEGFEQWNLTLSWDGKYEHFTLADIKKMPSYTGHGYLVSTTGIKYGPFTGTGIPIADIIQPMGNVNNTSRLYVYGSDEYLWVLDSGQISGEGYITFDENLSEIKDQHITPVLMYELDGKQITKDDGGPVRIALLTEKPGVITEGSGWVKWVSRIELHR